MGWLCYSYQPQAGALLYFPIHYAGTTSFQGCLGGCGGFCLETWIFSTGPPQNYPHQKLKGLIASLIKGNQRLMGVVLTSKPVGVVPDEPRPFASSAEPLSINYNESLETRGQVHGMEDGLPAVIFSKPWSSCAVFLQVWIQPSDVRVVGERL